MAAFGVYASGQFPWGKRPDETPRPAPFRLGWRDRAALTAIAVILVGIVGVAIAEIGRTQHSAPQASHAGGSEARPSAPPAPGPSQVARDSSWTAVDVMGAGLLLGCAVLVAIGVRSSRRHASGSAIQSGLGDVASALERAELELRADGDARVAVIRAYAAMEAALGRSGIGRRRSEAPREYMTRALPTLQVSSAAAANLTDLFERARFGFDMVDERMRREAADALATVRWELGG